MGVVEIACLSPSSSGSKLCVEKGTGTKRETHREFKPMQRFRPVHFFDSRSCSLERTIVHCNSEPGEFRELAFSIDYLGARGDVARQKRGAIHVDVVQ